MSKYEIVFYDENNTGYDYTVEAEKHFAAVALAESQHGEKGLPKPVSMTVTWRNENAQ